MAHLSRATLALRGVHKQVQPANGHKLTRSKAEQNVSSPLRAGAGVTVLG
jgi:hypothetical protein